MIVFARLGLLELGLLSFFTDSAILNQTNNNDGLVQGQFPSLR
jgi:hypothetical protein